jgi:hypothetical protein
MRFLVLFLVALPLSAQTVIDIGAAGGRQSYRAFSDNPRWLTSAEVLARRGNAGVHLAVEYADLSEEGALVVIHPDLVYRWPLGSLAVMAGVGPTYANIGGDRERPSILTWNAEAELEWRFGRSAVFARVRNYDFELQRDRAGESGPSGPAMYAGFRFTVAGSSARR